MRTKQTFRVPRTEAKEVVYNVGGVPMKVNEITVTGTGELKSVKKIQ